MLGVFLRLSRACLGKSPVLGIKHGIANETFFTYLRVRLCNGGVVRLARNLLDLNRPGQIGIAWVAGTVRERESGWVERDQRLRRAARERLSDRMSLSSPYVCPEPVLVK